MVALKRMIRPFVPVGLIELASQRNTSAARKAMAPRTPAASGILACLRTELYSEDSPFLYADKDFVDGGYPHTNLQKTLVDSILAEVRPSFWLEIGSMLGGSAILTADSVKSGAFDTEIICVDPFTGDVNMWAWERERKATGGWRFLRLNKGRPTIYDRFLANVQAAGHADVILPIATSSIVGLKLIQRLFDEGRIPGVPTVIYLDSAHEQDETFLELTNCWNVLPKGGILFGDDWAWGPVKHDVMKFAATVDVNRDLVHRLMQRHKIFAEVDGLLLDGEQWVLAK